MTHIVPWMAAVPRARGPQGALCRELQRLGRQMALPVTTELLTNHSTPQDITLVTFKQRETVDLPVFTPIQRFAFNINDYSITSKDLKHAKSEFRESRFPIISKDEPLCRDHTLLKGPNSDLYTAAFVKGLTKQKSIHKCSWFTFNYWHSSSYLGKIIKSRPGVMVVCHNTYMFNSGVSITGNIPASIQNTSYPFKFSVCRSKIRKLVRKHFLELYLADKTFAESFDGLYRFSCFRYPQTVEEVLDLVENICLSLSKVAKLDKDQLRNASIDSKVPWHEVSKVFIRNGITDAKLVIPPSKKKTQPKKQQQ